MTMRNHDVRRFTEPALGVVRDEEGRLVTEGLSREEIGEQERLAAIGDAWESYRTTGDSSALVELGIFPAQTCVDV